MGWWGKIDMVGSDGYRVGDRMACARVVGVGRWVVVGFGSVLVLGNGVRRGKVGRVG